MDGTGVLVVLTLAGVVSCLNPGVIYLDCYT
jgi:hypothetical protein